MSGRIVYKGRVFSVEVENVVLSNGHETELAIVRHRPSVVLIPVKDDGQIVLIRQYRHALKRDIWELPAGNVDEERRRRPPPRVSAKKRLDRCRWKSSALDLFIRRRGIRTRR